MSLLVEVERCYRSLLLHRMRTLLSTLGILFGVVAVVTMLSIGEGAKRESLEQIEQLGTAVLIVREAELSEEQQKKARENRSKGLTWSDVDLFAQHMEHVTTLVPMKRIPAAITGSMRDVTPAVVATTREFQQLKKYPLIEGRFLSEDDVRRKSRVCVLGAHIADKLGMEGHVGGVLRIENIPFTIVGILQNTRWVEGKSSTLLMEDPNQTLFIPLGAQHCLPRSHPGGGDHLTSIVLQLEESRYSETGAVVMRRLLQMGHGEEEDYQIVIPQELIEQAYKTQRTYNLVLGSIAAISLLVGGIGIMNIMLANVSERTREIGIRRAVGANQRHIIVQFLGEALLLTLTGAIAGIVLGVIGSWVISALAAWKTIVTWWSILLSLGMASGVGVCAGLYPAMKAAEMDPISALRHM